ncbi:MAG: PulJ/GspJ family protein [Thermodesulfobacteriota bacterium]
MTHFCKSKSNASAGFSLVEVIASLLLMAIIGGIWGLGMVQVIDGFLHSRQSAEAFMKGQMGIARMVKELRMASQLETDPPPSADAVEFLRTDDGLATRIRINHDPSSGTINLNGEVLVDEVRRFLLGYAQDYTEDPPPEAGPASPQALGDIRLDLDGPQETVVRLETRVFLRSLK